MPTVWFYYYGRILNMTNDEVDYMTLGEMLDLIACHQIFNGAEEDLLLTDEDMIPDLD